MKKILLVILLSVGLISVASDPTPLLTYSEVQCIQILQNPTASLKEKFDACRQLAVIGTEKSIPILASLLRDSHLFEMARYALEPMPYPQVDQELVNAIDELPKKQLIGIIHSIGVRKSRVAIPKLASLVTKSEDIELRCEAARALGSIGVESCIEPLLTLLKSEKDLSIELNLAVSEALLKCAESLASSGNRELARNIYDVLISIGNKIPQQIIVAAWRGAVLTRGILASSLFKQALQSQPDAVVAALIGLFSTDPPDWAKDWPMAKELILTELTTEFALLPVSTKYLLLKTIDSTIPPSVIYPLIELALRDTDPLIRAEAIFAIGRAQPPGGATVVFAMFNDESPQVVQAAKTTWIRINDPSIDLAVKMMLRAKDPAIVSEACNMIVERAAISAIPDITQLIKHKDLNVRIAAIQALGILGNDKELKLLISLLSQTDEQMVLPALENSINRLLNTISNPAQYLDELYTTLRVSPLQKKETLLRLIASIPSERTLSILIEILKTDQPLRNATIRIIANWPEQTILPYLESLIKQAVSEQERQILLEGYLKWAQEENLPISTKLQICQIASNYATDKNIASRLLSAIGKTPIPEVLDIMTKFVDSEELQAEVAVALVKIAEPLSKQSLTSDQKAKLQQLINKYIDAPALSPQERQRLKNILQNITN